MLPFVCFMCGYCCRYVAVCLFYVRLLLQVCCRLLLYCITTVRLLLFVCCCAAVAAGIAVFADFFCTSFVVCLLLCGCCCRYVVVVLYCCCSSVAVCMLLYSYVFFIRFIALCLVLNVFISMAVDFTADSLFRRKVHIGHYSLSVFNKDI